MSSLQEYIEKIKKDTEGFSDIEKLRYVYIDLGKRFQFDLNFSFGNSKEKRKIYEHSKREEDLDKSMDSNIGICKSIAYIFERVIKSLNINATTIIDSDDYRKCPHVYNVVTTSNGNRYMFDLQEDMRYIKAYLRTRYFGIPMEGTMEPMISRYDLDQIDKKLGYITRDLYYTDEYIELIKMHMELFENFGERVQFVLENSEGYTDKNMGYADRRWRMEDLIGSGNKAGLLFSREEKNKIHIVDCYRQNNGRKDYELCIAVDVKGDTDIYMFSEKTNSFEKKTMSEFAELVEGGLVNMSGINGLKQELRKRRNKEGEEK